MKTFFIQVPLIAKKNPKILSGVLAFHDNFHGIQDHNPIENNPTYYNKSKG